MPLLIIINFYDVYILYWTKITYSLIDKYLFNKKFEDYYKDVKDNKLPIINKIVKTYDGIDKVPEPPLDPETELISRLLKLVHNKMFMLPSLLMNQ